MHLSDRFLTRGRAPRFAALTLLSLLAISRVASSAPTLGFRERWPGTSVQGWSGNFAITYSNPGSGGVGGNGDGFLRMSKAPPGSNFGTRSVGPEYVGNWQAAGITQIRLWLNDVNTDEPFEIHLAIGNFSNLWQYNQGFLPPLNRWGEFTVDLNDSANFTRTIAIDSLGFNFALQNVAVLHIRHDLAPYTQTPDTISGDLGLDELLLTNGVVGVERGAPAALHPVELAAPYPNPSRGPVALGVATRDGGEVRLQIVDVLGRIVRSATLAPGAAGPRLWIWDGTDDHGARVPAGAYRARAIASSGGTSRALVRIQ